MQALTFARTLKRVVSELKAQELVQFVNQYLIANPPNTGISQEQKDTFSTLIVDSIAGLTYLNNDPDAKKIIDRLGVTDIYSAPRIGRLMGLFASAANHTQFASNPYLSEFVTFKALLSMLIRVSDTSMDLLEGERIPKLDPAQEQIVEFEILAGNHGEGVDLDRLRRFLSTLIDLHSQLALLLKIPNVRPQVVYVDSGSILLAIKTVVGVASALVLLFTQTWEKIKYAPHENLNRNLDSLSKTLTVTKEIDAQIEAKTLDENLGKAIKHKILTDVCHIIDLGAVIPAKESTEQREQKKLLTERVTKLLSAGETQAEEDPTDEERKV